MVDNNEVEIEVEVGIDEGAIPREHAVQSNRSEVKYDGFNLNGQSLISSYISNRFVLLQRFL